MRFVGKRVDSSKACERRFGMDPEQELQRHLRFDGAERSSAAIESPRLCVGWSSVGLEGSAASPRRGGGAPRAVTTFDGG